MKFRIQTEHVIEATGVEDAARKFATAIMAIARSHSEAPKDRLIVQASDGARFSITPVSES